jgi:hypothetical protein
MSEKPTSLSLAASLKDVCVDDTVKMKASNKFRSYAFRRDVVATRITPKGVTAEQDYKH